MAPNSSSLTRKGSGFFGDSSEPSDTIGIKRNLAHAESNVIVVLPGDDWDGGMTMCEFLGRPGRIDEELS